MNERIKFFVNSADRAVAEEGPVRRSRVLVKIVKPWNLRSSEEEAEKKDSRREMSGLACFWCI